MILPSCGLLNILNGNQAVYQTSGGAVVNPVTAAISSIAPNPRNLTAQEGPATELCGYLDYYGNWYIMPQYRYAGEMSSDGFAIVQMADTGLWGAIDRRNDIVVQPNFKSRYDAESALNKLLRK